MLDTFREVVTPEGVTLRLPAAGPVPRALAWGIDFGIRIGIVTVGSGVTQQLGEAGLGIGLVLTFLVYWAYPIVCEGLMGGRTPGKMAMGLRVLSADGAPIGWLASIVRNLLRAVDMLPFGYAFGLITSLCDPWGRRLGDLVAGTVVVHAARERAPAAAQDGGAQAPAVPLRPQEQMAVIAFGERAGQLTPERQIELGDLLAPLTGVQGWPGVLRLYGIASWLLGRSDTSRAGRDGAVTPQHEKP